jgi:predicted metal-binding membrane protein
MMAELPRRDRAAMLAGLSLVCALAWGYTWHVADDHMAWCSVNTAQWSAADLAASFAMWTVMMAAMMVPSVSPTVLTYAGIVRARREKAMPASAAPEAQCRPAKGSAVVFLAGYLAAWTAFSVAATAAQQGLRSAALLSPEMAANSRWIARALLIAAGIFQWTPLKNACLRHCRSPLGFLLTEWRDGRAGALRMGWRHGLYCVGCCWLLMALLFVVGVMNLVWVAAIAAFVIVEKIMPAGPVVGRLAGLAMIACAVWVVR